MKCRHCQAGDFVPLIDLATSPPSNAYLSPAALDAPETWFPLRVFVCTHCWLAQTQDYADHAALFAPDYAYFSSYSASWLLHAERFVEMAVQRFALGPERRVIEVASNDGYLLKYVQARGIPCLGIEPTASTAAAARAAGIEVVEEFFGVELARRLAAQGLCADLAVANNVLAHVPDINDFVAGFAVLLAPQGVACFEFPHLMALIDGCQFDTIYHEHFSYLSLTAVQRIFQRAGLVVFDVQELATHGGSLRVFAQRADHGRHPLAPAVAELLRREASCGMTTEAYYRGLQPRAERVKTELLRFLLDARRDGKRVVGYGAAAKGNTLLNFAGVRADLLPWVVDRNPAKQGKYLPGSRIAIVTEDRLRLERPDFVLILPWNLRDEVMQQLSYVRDWSGRFVLALPTLSVQ